jgi:hypothetical protein
MAPKEDNSLPDDEDHHHAVSLMSRRTTVVMKVDAETKLDYIQMRQRDESWERLHTAATKSDPDDGDATATIEFVA